MSCCRKTGCKNDTAQNLPTSEFSARDTIAAAKEAMTKLLNLAHINNKVLPGDISPLALANLIADLLTTRQTPPSQPAPQTSGDFVLRFGPNKAYELYLPAGDTTQRIKDPQKFFDFDRT